MEDSKESTVSVPKFDKVPWLSDASLRNKPLLLSLPKRYPHTSATFLISYKKDTNLPSLFQVPDDSFQARRKPNDPALVRNRQLCASCWEMRMARPRTTQDSGDQTLSFEAFMSRKTRNSTESVFDALGRGRRHLSAEGSSNSEARADPRAPSAASQKLQFLPAVFLVHLLLSYQEQVHRKYSSV
ncbi:uncharacterized protein C1orf105 homolog isoform X4 [Sturnira hondurensis]|uniref:uncharacterized protein C1orf105 homolog isoform X4 n=1 Tax=Sturnira hondurensis TaxID=192404 RepID=UPI00187901C9|nr:uncharacterized protein C1orf105 homolog isoform X4 [Sturnira hondurensis]